MAEREPLLVPEPPPPEIGALRREIQTLKKRLQAVRGGEEIILRAVLDAWLEPPDLSIPPVPKQSKQKRHETALLHVTDTQIGKLTESYSAAVAETRILRLADLVRETTEIRRGGAAIDEIVVLFGGDMIEGENIFPGQAHQIDQGLFEQACKTAPSIFVRLILSLLEIFPRVRVAAVCGNHGRPGQKSMGSSPRTNWDRVCYQITRDILLGTEDHPRRELEKRLSFQIADSFYAVEYVYDWGCLLIHGDQIRGGFAGFPWYGTAKKAWGWIDSVREEWDYLYFGHFHQMVGAVLNLREFFCGGSTESGNVYAQEQMAACGHPRQRLQFFSAAKGIISDHPLYLEAAGERLPQRVRRRHQES